MPYLLNFKYLYAYIKNRMSRKSCPRIEHCRLVAGHLTINEVEKETCVKKYCQGDFTSCKRLIVLEKIHFCPDFVFPDSSCSIDEVLDKMENEPDIKN
jgi:hypothetical protein